MRITKKQEKELKKLKLLVRTFGNLMYKRLAEKHLRDNFIGWNTVDKYEVIQKMLVKKANQIIQLPYTFDDFIDLCNVAMFSYNNKYSIEGRKK